MKAKGRDCFKEGREESKIPNIKKSTKVRTRKYLVGFSDMVH